MHIHQIETRPCNTLPGLHLAEVSAGLNVVLGPNGSGKTSLLRFTGELLGPAGARGPGATRSLPIAGAVDLETRLGPVRVVRVSRPGHPDTTAVVARTAAAAEQVRSGREGDDSETASLLRYVGTNQLHRTTALAALAADVTEQLSAQELGPDWRIARAAEASVENGTAAAPPLMRILPRLADATDDGDPQDAVPAGDLAAIDANWQTVIGALARQREQATLACEAHARMQTRRQREWETRLRWLGELAAAQAAEIERLDADWQVAESDLREATATPQSSCAGTAPTNVVITAAALPGNPERQLDLLRQVLEDLAADRLQTLLQMARADAAGAREGLEAECRRIDGCEREIVGQMQRLLQRRERQAGAAAGVCPTCGAPRGGGSGDDGPAAAPGSDTTALADRAAELHQRVFAARRQLAATQRRSARLEQLRRRHGNDWTSDRLRYDISVLDQQIAELELERRSELAAAAIAVRRRVGLRHNVLRRAGAHLSRLTSGRYVGLRWNAADAELLTEDAGGQLAPLAALSRGTGEQVAMSLRLAVLHGLGCLGNSGPVLWDEPLADSDEQRLAAAAALLAEFGRSGSQLLLFTCREHVARALQQHGARVHLIGGAVLRGAQAAPMSPLPRPADAPAPDAAEEPVSSGPVRVLPGSTYWLHADASLDQVPSLGPQFARRLRAIGIAEVRDLLDFDPVAARTPLDELQINPSLVQIWQAEARLLTEVAGLTGRDAQLLVSCGLLTRADLAAADVEELTRRIDRLRGGDTLRWRFGQSTAPHRETIGRWVEAARKLPPADPTRWSDAPDASDGTSRGRPRRGSIRPVRTPVPTPPPAVASRFRLQPDSPIVDAPSIGHKTGRRLLRVGIATVRDLLVCDPQETADRLRHRRITRETVESWQRQAGLMCAVPDLRCADAIVLVACGITGPLDLRRISAAALWASLSPLLASSGGQRLLRGAAPPTLDDVARWIATVEEARVRRAA